MCVFVCVFICVSLFFFRTGRKLAKTMWNASQKAFFMYFDALLNLARQMFSAQANLMRYLACHSPSLSLLIPLPFPDAYCELCNASGNDISRQCDLIASPAAAAASAASFSLKVSKTPWPSVPETGRMDRERGRERERKREMEKYKEREGNVSSCRGTPWKSPDIAHISHIYRTYIKSAACPLGKQSQKSHCRAWQTPFSPLAGIQGIKGRHWHRNWLKCIMHWCIQILQGIYKLKKLNFFIINEFS